MSTHTPYQKHTWVTKEIIRREYLQNIEDGIYQEQQDAEAAETALENALNTETLRAKAKETEIANNLTQEITRATAAEEEITQSIQDDLDELSERISNEYTRATGVESSLQAVTTQNTNDIAAEVSRATQAESDLHDYVDQQVTRTYKPSGSIYFADLPALAASRLGNVYDIKDGFTTTSDFTEGAGVKYGAGTNVAIVDIGSGTYKYDCMPGSTVIGVKGDSESNYRTGQINITKANIGLGNVGNYKAVSTVANQGLSDTEKANARANIGAGSATGGTVTQVSTGAGLTGGDITTTGTIKAKLKSETQSSLTAAARGSTSDREYPIGLDADGNLSVNVPWTNTTYTPQKLGFGYATCSTAAATTAKVATLTDYVLVKNGYVSVKFTNSVPASATLNVNSKGAKAIYYHGAAITAGVIGAGDMATFVYDGTNYNLVGVDNVSSQIQTLTNNGNWRTGLRFKNLGTSFTAQQATALANGDFSEFWNGDYWVINGHNWRIVDNSGWARRRGETNFNSNSLVVMPDDNLVLAEAYLIDGGTSGSNTDTHGYANCGYRTDEKSGKGRTQCKTLFQNAFGSSHVASHRELMSTSRGTGGALSWAWQDADVELPSEVNIYGHSVWGNGLEGGVDEPSFNIGDRWGQFMLFRLAPYMAINRGQNYWLRDIHSASYFAYVDYDGYANYSAPSTTYVGLRPYSIIK